MTDTTADVSEHYTLTALLRKLAADGRTVTVHTADGKSTEGTVAATHSGGERAHLGLITLVKGQTRIWIPMTQITGITDDSGFPLPPSSTTPRRLR